MKANSTKRTPSFQHVRSDTYQYYKQGAHTVTDTVTDTQVPELSRVFTVFGHSKHMDQLTNPHGGRASWIKWVTAVTNSTIYHLLRTGYMLPGIPVIDCPIWLRSHYYFHFSDENTEAQKHWVTILCNSKNVTHAVWFHSPCSSTLLCPVLLGEMIKLLVWVGFRKSFRKQWVLSWIFMAIYSLYCQCYSLRILFVFEIGYISQPGLEFSIALAF